MQAIGAVLQDDQKGGEGVIGYKVTEVKDDGRYFSSSQQKGDGGVYYEEGQWTSPLEKCGPLLLFNEIEAAQQYARWVSGCGIFVIWEAEYEPSSAKDVHCGWYSTSVDEMEQDICDGRLQYTMLLADRIKLLKMVQP